MTYATDKALFMPFCTHGADGDVGYWECTCSTFRFVKPQMTVLAVGMTLVNDECVCLSFVLVGMSGGFCTWRGRFGRVEKGIATFRAEEVKLVIVSLSENLVFERDKPGIDDGCFAMVAFVSEFLLSAELHLTPTSW